MKRLERLNSRPAAFMTLPVCALFWVVLGADLGDKKTVFTELCSDAIERLIALALISSTDLKEVKLLCVCRGALELKVCADDRRMKR